ncbi:uncharacterized protein [Parasteatoda tepidariorum]|nr:glutaredoxin-2, mitochondrial [Parasteatoda tepidariorum]
MVVKTERFYVLQIICRLLKIVILSMGTRFSSSSPKMFSSVERKLINELINKHCVVIFSKSHCIYCRKVKKLFDENNINFTTIELDKREDGSNMQDVLHEITGSRTVPRVFINSECIGGASDTEKLYQENKLFEKIKLCSSRL